MKTTKRIISLILCIAMVAGMFAFQVSTSAVCNPGDVVEFGMFPQSDASSVAGLASLGNEWKTCGFLSNGTKDIAVKYTDVTFLGTNYRGVKFTEKNAYRPYNTDLDATGENSYQDENGYKAPTNALFDKTYWFKCEPIKWIVADKSGTLIAKDIIDAQCFNNSAASGNTYSSSTIRSLLSDAFYKTAFSSDEKAVMLAVSGNDFASLPAAAMINDSNKSAKATDYAKCMGIEIAAQTELSAYILSGAGADGKCAFIDKTGNQGETAVNNVSGIRPVIKVNNLNKYTVNYDKNHTNAILLDSVDSQFAINKFTISSQPTLIGYDFIGWNTDKNATTAQYQPGDSFVASAENTTFYAIWKAKEFTVYFDVNKTGAVLDGPDSKVVTFDQPYGELPTAVAENYVFIGWYTNPKMSDGYQVKAGDRVTGLITTLYAQYTTPKTITFDANGGSGAPEPLTGDIYYTIPAAVPTYQGKFFLGWKNATILTDDNLYLPGDSIEARTVNLTLKALWADPHNVTFDANGGTGAPATLSGNIRYTIPSQTPTRSGYVFMGWADVSKPGVVVYKPGNEISVVTGNASLVAVWVKVNVEMAISDPTQTTIKKGDSIDLHLSIVTNMPGGTYKVVWSADNENFTLSPSSDGRTCTITASSNGSANITVTLCDMGNNPLNDQNSNAARRSVSMNSKAGIFQIIRYWFISVLHFGSFNHYSK